MNLKELLRTEGKKMGFSDKDIDEAELYAGITNYDMEPDMLTKDLPEEVIELIRNYVREIITNAKSDPEFAKSFIEFADQRFKK